MTYVKGYGVLTAYCLLTHMASLGFWQLEPCNRSWWIIGAVATLVLAPGWRRQVA